MEIKIRLMPGGQMPKYKKDDDGCLDCYARVNRPGAIIIENEKRETIPLGFAIEIPKGYKGHVKPRSGLNKDGIDVCLGTIDSNYRGEVSATVCNNSGKTFDVWNGDRIAQFEVVEDIRIIWKKVESLSETERGEKGFGSSGIRD